MLALLAILAAAAGGGALAVTRKSASPSLPKIGFAGAGFTKFGKGTGQGTFDASKFWTFGRANHQAIAQRASGGDAAALEAQLSDALRRAEAKIRDEFNRLGAEAKKRGADAINQSTQAVTGINPGVLPTDSFETVSGKVGAAYGNFAATKGCESLGLGAASAACGKLGAIVGKFLGKEIGPYLDEAWADVKAWAEEAANDVGQAIGGAAKDTGRAIVGAANDVADFLGF